MAKIPRRITGEVDIPTLQTEVAGPGPAPENPILGAVGELAGRAAEFVQAYKAAEFNFQATEADAAITAEINNYQENLRTNPILPEPGDADDIITKKEKNWLEFAERIQKDLIGNVGNTQLRNKLTQSWRSRTEDIRNKVVNNALDENMRYMSNRLNDNINTATSNILDFSRQARDAAASGDLETAHAFETSALLAAENAEVAITRAEASGLITREQAEEGMDVVDRYEALGHTYLEGMSYSESKQYINESNLSAENKTEAHKVLKANEDERLRVEAEQLKATQDANLEEGFFLIANDQITRETELEALFPDGRRYEALDGPQSEQLRAALRRRQKERDTGDTGRDNPEALARIDIVFMNPNATREDALTAMYEEAGRGLISSTTYNSLYKKLDTDAFRNKNEQAFQYTVAQVERLKEEGALGSTPQQIAIAEQAIWEAVNNLQYGDHLTAREKATEQGYTLENAKQFIANLNDTIVVKALEEGYLREPNDPRHWTNAEELLRLSAEGQIYGKVFTDQIGGFLNDSTMTTEDLKNSISRSLGAKYSDLSDIDKSKVKITMAVGDLVRKTGQLFNVEYGIDGTAGFDVRSSLPTITLADGTLYRLNIDEEKKQETWEIWSEEDRGFIPDPNAPDTDTASRGQIQTTYEDLIGLPGEFRDFLLTSPVEAQQAAAELSESLREEARQARIRNIAELRSLENQLDNSTSLSELSKPSVIKNLLE